MNPDNAWEQAYYERDRAYARLAATNAALRDALQRVVDWSEAYPLDVFPEPDFKRAAELLKAGGMTLDAIGASNMRRVVTGVGEIARKALASQPVQELGFLDQPPVSAIFDGSITERLSKTRQMLEKKLASRPEVKT
jgi:hypothetical protein